MRTRIVPPRPRRQLARAAANRRVPERPLDRQPSTRGVTKRRGTRTPAPAQSSRAAFSFMSPTAGQRDDRAAARGERAHERAVAGVADDEVALGHGARVGDPLDDARVVGHRQRARRQAPVAGGEHAHRRVGEPAKRGAEQPVLGVLGGRRRDQHERRVAPAAARPRRAGRLPHQRPDDVHVCGPRARVLELREAWPTSASSRLMPPWTCASGARPSWARVSLSSRRPRSRPRRDGPLSAPPQRAPEQRCAAGARRASRSGSLGRAVRVDVGDQRRARHALQLGGERGREREDVRDDDVGLRARARAGRVSAAACTTAS